MMKTLSRRGLFALPAALPAMALADDGCDVELTVTNHTRVATFDTKLRVDHRGVRLIDVVIDDVERRLSSRLARGEGPLGQVLAGRYGR